MTVAQPVLTGLACLTWICSSHAISRPPPEDISIEGGKRVLVQLLDQVKPARDSAYQTFSKSFLAKWNQTEKEVGENGKNARIAGSIPFLSAGASCKGSAVYIFDHSRLKIISDDDPRGPHADAGYLGTAGMPFSIHFYASTSGKLTKAFEKLVQSVIGVRTSSTGVLADCPDFIVQLHGSEFKRAGNLSGLALVTFDPSTQKYRVSSENQTK